MTLAELVRAFEIAQNWGGWSYEEAELMARALLTLKDGTFTGELDDHKLIVVPLARLDGIANKDSTDA